MAAAVRGTQDVGGKGTNEHTPFGAWGETSNVSGNALRNRIRLTGTVFYAPLGYTWRNSTTGKKR